MSTVRKQVHYRLEPVDYARLDVWCARNGRTKASATEEVMYRFIRGLPAIDYAAWLESQARCDVADEPDYHAGDERPAA